MACNESCNKEVTQCQKKQNNTCTGSGNSNFVIVIVLYILLAIIIGSCLI